MDGEQTPRSASRTRLESFRLQHDTRRLSAQPDQESSHQSIPSLPLDTLRASAAQGNDSPSARPLSTRRLKKELLCGDSRNRDISNAAGHVQLVDQCGTPRSVRVVQQEALEDFNMVSVKWLWSVDNKTHQIDLRHGRVSGIRKIYVNREMIFRSKQLSDLFADRGSRHAFEVGGLPAEVRIELGRGAGFRYHLTIGGEEIERELGIEAPGLTGELGTRLIRIRAHRAFGMTLANCGMRRDGVVVIDLENGQPAQQAGLQVGDILLSVDDEQVLDTTIILDRLHNLDGEVTLEVAGATPSRMVTIPNPFSGTNNGNITINDTSCGVGVYVATVEQWTSVQPAGTGRLERGDVILSCDGAVTESAKETTKYMRAGPRLLAVVLTGRSAGDPVGTPR